MLIMLWSDSLITDKLEKKQGSLEAGDKEKGGLFQMVVIR